MPLHSRLDDLAVAPDEVDLRESKRVASPLDGRQHDTRGRAAFSRPCTASTKTKPSFATGAFRTKSISHFPDTAIRHLFVTEYDRSHDDVTRSASSRSTRLVAVVSAVVASSRQASRFDETTRAVAAVSSAMSSLRVELQELRRDAASEMSSLRVELQELRRETTDQVRQIEALSRTNRWLVEQIASLKDAMSKPGPKEEDQFIRIVDEREISQSTEEFRFEEEVHIAALERDNFLRALI